MKKSVTVSFLLAVIVLCFSLTGFAANDADLLITSKIRKASATEVEKVQSNLGGVTTYSTDAEEDWNITIDWYLTHGCAQRYGEDINLYFYLKHTGKSDEQYFVYIYDSNENLLAGTYGDYPSGSAGDIFTLTLTWPWNDQAVGKYYVEFFATSDTESQVGWFYIAQPGVEQSVEVAVPYTTLMVGETTQISATAPGYIEYYSENEEIATVSENGLITALSSGTVEIEIFVYPTETYPWTYKTVTIRVASQPVEDFVRRYYVNIMGREPDAGGLNYWVEKLKSGQKTAADVADYFIFCDEFVVQNNSDDVFIDRLYLTFFGRSSDQGGKAYWMDYLSKGATRRWVAAQFVNSTEFQVVCDEYGLERGTLQLEKYADKKVNLTMYVIRCYEEILNRSADPSGLEYWCKAIYTGEKEATAVAKNFVNSNEFIKKNLSDTEYVKVLYRAFMDREADAGGLNYWVGRLEKGESRNSVLNAFAGCKEFLDILKSFGL